MPPTAKPERLSGALLRAARELRGWSQQHLAEELGAGRGSVAAWERGTVAAQWRQVVEELLGEELARAEAGEVPTSMSGAEFRRLREGASLSREELAIQLGVSVATLSDWEISSELPLARAAEARHLFAAVASPEPGRAGGDERTSLSEYTLAELAEEIARRAREES
ncbi:helix-turn-helix domain-containing protein [Pseudoclavibacter helvolus]|uniref:helix-turn-helix domain-containing protein n=1 Tax=Pseudoclavibacter helvolus TaxID=255205 RepID=UPI003C717662